MKKFIDYINESTQKWVAIVITTSPSWPSTKPKTSQRVVTVDTYNELKSTGYTKSHHNEVLSISKLCEPTSREQAMTYLDKNSKTHRKSKINKKGADYIVYAITLGKLTPGGSTNFNYNLWEEFDKDKTEIYVLNEYPRHQYFLIGAKGSLDLDDIIIIADNDSHKLLSSGNKFKVSAILPADKEGFVEGYRKEFGEHCKKPSVSFGRQLDGIPWKYFNQIYSIKGVTEEE